MEVFGFQVQVCNGEGCNSIGAKKIVSLLKAELKQNGLDKDVEVIKTGCVGLCNLGPSIIVHPDSIVYANVRPSDIHELVVEHFIKGKPLERLVYKLKTGDGRIRSLDKLDMFKKQERIVLRNCGIINPEDIEEYIARDGYKALGKVLTEMSPEEVVDVIKKSGLRGRGGGGFPTGAKWEFAAKQKNDQKYIICNADEGDPGAFMDRSVLEGDPHAVLEAMAIGGYAIGANKGFIYVRAEYPLAVERIKIAIAQAKEYGVLGQTAPNPILSTLRYFKDEYISHVVDKKCPAKACKKLIEYKIKRDLCKKCGLCAKNCSANAISSNEGEGYIIDINQCIRCDVCRQVCAFNAIVKE